MEKNILSKLNFKVFLIGFLVLVQAVGLVFFFRHYFESQSKNQKQINALINEIGELKEENQYLYQLNEQKDQFLTNLNAHFQSFQLKYSALDQEKQTLQTEQTKTQQELEQAKQQAQTVSSQLTNQLNQKQSEVENLKTAQQLQDEIKSISENLYSLLILGENSKLTDTIILLVINKESKKITMVSIPRDLSYQGRKVNEYFASYGAEKTKDIIKEITGVRPQNYIKVDFDAVIKSIDFLGGVDIQVDKQLIDPYYPTSNFGYKKVVFEEGLEHMDGTRALEYARSRKTTSDFDRSLRQQKVLIAIKEKIKSMGLMKNLQYFMTAYDDLSKNLQTDLNILEAFNLFETSKGYNLSAGNLLSNQNHLYSTKNYKGQYILLPNDKDFLTIKKAILEII
ncbi:MAG: LCP family protein [Candidatus Altimarinota bacterium]